MDEGKAAGTGEDAKGEKEKGVPPGPEASADDRTERLQAFAEASERGADVARHQKGGPVDQGTEAGMQTGGKQLEGAGGAGMASAGGGSQRDARSQSSLEGMPEPPVKVSEVEAAVNMEQELLVR